MHQPGRACLPRLYRICRHDCPGFALLDPSSVHVRQIADDSKREGRLDMYFESGILVSGAPFLQRVLCLVLPNTKVVLQSPTLYACAVWLGWQTAMTLIVREYRHGTLYC